MATKRWQPKALPVAQVARIEVSAYDAATTYSLEVNGLTLASQAGNASANQTATDLAALWNAATTVYATGVTAAADAANITFTGDTAEVPFTVSGAVASGNGTLGNFTTDTAPTGPHTVTDADNWGGTLPSANDTIVVENTDVSLLWGLDGLSTGNHVLVIDGTFTGLIGLDRRAYALGADGGNTSTTVPEYRPVELELDCRRIEIGGHTGQGTPANSSRILINNTRSASSQTVVYSSRPNGDSANQSPARLRYANAAADIDMRSGQIAVALDAAEQTSTIGNVTVQDGGFYCGAGTTISGSFSQRRGDSQLDLGSATLSSAAIHGGQLRIEGDQVVTTLDVWGGDCECNTSGNVTTANARGGRLMFRSAEAHTVPTLNIYRGASVQYDPDVTTITSLVLIDDGPSLITVGEARG